MATLYDVGLPTINEYIKKIYADSELEESATIRNFRIVQIEGSRQVTRDTKHYNLQMIIAVGFKVNNERAGNAVTGANCINTFLLQSTLVWIGYRKLTSIWTYRAMWRR